MRLLACTLLLLSTACSEPKAPLAAEGAFYHQEGPDGAMLHLAEQPVRILPTSSSTADIALALVSPERLAGLPETVRSYSHEIALNGFPADLPTFNNYNGETMFKKKDLEKEEKFPPSTIIPPIDVPCPPIYFVKECITTAAP